MVPRQPARAVRRHAALADEPAARVLSAALRPPPGRRASRRQARPHAAAVAARRLRAVAPAVRQFFSVLLTGGSVRRRLTVAVKELTASFPELGWHLPCSDCDRAHLPAPDCVRDDQLRTGRD